MQKIQTNKERLTESKRVLETNRIFLRKKKFTGTIVDSFVTLVILFQIANVCDIHRGSCAKCLLEAILFWPMQ
jgi:hypothetical protein